MKRAFLTALMVCLLIAPARAEEVTNQPMEDDTQSSHVVVATLDELQEAIAAAVDGDTIAITQTIKIAGEDISTDKDITPARKLLICNGAAINTCTATFEMKTVSLISRSVMP